MILQVNTQPIIDKAFEISPTNVYGFIVGFLIIIVLIEGYLLIKLGSKYLDFVEKSNKERAEYMEEQNKTINSQFQVLANLDKTIANMAEVVRQATDDRLRDIDKNLAIIKENKNHD